MKIKVLLLFVILTFSSLCLSAQTTKSRGVPAYPYFQELKQPDGTKVSLKMCGDRVLNWLETEDGTKVLRNKDGWFTYATSDSKGFMIPSARHVGVYRNGLGGQQIAGDKKIFFNSKQIENRERAYFGDKIYSQMRVQGRNSFALQKASFPTIGGPKKSIMILAEFSDVPHRINASEFHHIMNQENYNNTGSFRDYYLENSYGQFDCTTDIVKDGNNTYVWVTLPNTMKYYGENGGTYDQDMRPEKMIVDACREAEKVGVDFSDYDNDNDGEVDNVMVIHSGYGEEAGGSSDAIWSHRHKLYYDAIYLDGVKIYNYITFPELSGSSGSESTNIGVLVHEFGHALGLPDYYDADYEGSGGNAYGLGRWDVMSGGSWNDNGITPAQHNAYSKYFLKWIDLPVLNDVSNPIVGSLELKDVTSNKEGGAYMIKSVLDGEFFVIENRQQKKFNSAIPSHGMLVYHIDLNYKTSNNGYYYSAWDMNTMNNDPSHQAMEILFAGKSTYGSTIPFPGSRNVSTLSDFTGEDYSVVKVKKSHDPTLVNWDLSESKSSFRNIREEDGVVKFTYSPNQKVNLNLSLVYKFDGVVESNIDFTGYKLKIVNNSTNSQVIKDLDSEGNVSVDDFVLGTYDLTLIGGDKQIVYKGKTYDISFVKEYENINLASANVEFELKSNRNLKVAFRYGSDLVDIDYSGFSLEFDRDGIDPARINLDANGECSLNTINGGLYNIKLYASKKDIFVDGKKYTVTFKDTYNDVEVLSSDITLDLEEEKEIQLVFKFDNISESNVNYGGDRITLKQGKDEKTFDVDEDGKVDIEGVKAGIYDVSIESDEKNINVSGESYSVIFMDKYEKVNIDASQIKLELQQRFFINLIFKYDGTNESVLDYKDDAIVLEYQSEKTSFSINSNGVAEVNGVSHVTYNASPSFITKNLVVDGRKSILRFVPSYEISFREVSSNIDLELKLLSIADSDDIKIFPNPTTGYAQIEASFSNDAIIRIYDMKGMLVIEKKIASDVSNGSVLHGVDLSLLNAGVYNLLIIDGKSKISKRIIKE